MENRIQLPLNLIVDLLKDKYGDGLRGFGFDLSEDAPMLELEIAYNEVNDAMGLWVSQKQSS